MMHASCNEVGILAEECFFNDERPLAERVFVAMCLAVSAQFKRFVHRLGVRIIRFDVAGHGCTCATWTAFTVMVEFTTADLFVAALAISVRVILLRLLMFR